MSILQTIKRLLGIKTQIPQPEDDGFRPSTYSEGYGSTGDSHEAGGRYYGIREASGTVEMDVEPAVIDRLLEPVRCESRLRQRAGSGGNRSWRCTLDAGHLNGHLNGAGGRRW